MVEIRPEGDRFLRLLEILGQWYEKGKIIIFVQTQVGYRRKLCIFAFFAFCGENDEGKVINIVQSQVGAGDRWKFCLFVLVHMAR